jgi:hypothetical protein
MVEFSGQGLTGSRFLVKKIVGDKHFFYLPFTEFHTRTDRQKLDILSQNKVLDEYLQSEKCH